MGQQQILLIVLGAIIVGIATVVGITMFNENAANANLDAVSNDLLNIASRAQQYFRKPTSMGGGGKSFTGLTADAAGIAKLTSTPTNDNGTLSISTAGNDTLVVIQGVGVEDADGNSTPVTVLCTVTPSGASLSVTDR